MFFVEDSLHCFVWVYLVFSRIELCLLETTFVFITWKSMWYYLRKAIEKVLKRVVGERSHSGSDSISSVSEKKFTYDFVLSVNFQKTFISLKLFSVPFIILKKEFFILHPFSTSFVWVFQSTILSYKRFLNSHSKEILFVSLYLFVCDR